MTLRESCSLATDIFNSKMQEFIRDLSDAFPDMQDFKLCKNALNLAVSFSPEKPQKIFHIYVAVPYETEIIEKDEGFFLAHDFREVLMDGDFDIVDRIRSVWHRMSEDNKFIVWKYMQVLLLLDKKMCHCD
jgi:hypothetical protein